MFGVSQLADGVFVSWWQNFNKPATQNKTNPPNIAHVIILIKIILSLKNKY